MSPPRPEGSEVGEGSVPEDLRYSTEHEWARLEDESLVRVGITDFAQDQLGDVVYVDLPAPGTEIEQGQPFGEVESTKSVSDLYAPVSGTIDARNDALDDRPELVNEDPYGEGWMVAIRASDPGQLDSLLDAGGYRTHIE
ncbi:MAG: glycine cleavage system protein GcvH [Nitriliruptorales bacterium]